MHPPAARLRPEPARALRWTAVACALAVWMLGLLAASPQLHTSLHRDANHLEHTCAVTLFNHGVEAGLETTVVASAPLLFPAGTCPVQPAMPVAGAKYRLPPVCGPPLC